MNKFQAIFAKLTNWFDPDKKSQDTSPFLTFEPILLIKEKTPEVDYELQFSGDGSAEVAEELPELTLGSIYSSSTVFTRDRKDWSEDNHKELKALGREAAQNTGGFISAFISDSHRLVQSLFHKLTPSQRKALEEQKTKHQEEKAFADNRCENISIKDIPLREKRIEFLKKTRRKKNEGFPSIEYGICAATLVGISLYLFVYYINVFHSAFFWNPAIELEATSDASILFQSIFHDRFLEEISLITLFFLALAPSILFLGAYCLHLAGQVEDLNKRLACVATVLLLIFAVDGVAAYHIGEQIYTLKQQGGLIPSTPIWSLNTAITDLSVYTVLLFGFVPSILMGVALSRVLHLDRNRPTKIQYRQIEELQNEIIALEQESAELRKKSNIAAQAIYRINTALDSRYFDLPYIKGCLYAFASGWMQGLKETESDAIVCKSQFTAINREVKALLNSLRQSSQPS